MANEFTLRDRLAKILGERFDKASERINAMNEFLKLNDDEQLVFVEACERQGNNAEDGAPTVGNHCDHCGGLTAQGREAMGPGSDLRACVCAPKLTTAEALQVIRAALESSRHRDGARPLECLEHIGRLDAVQVHLEGEWPLEVASAERVLAIVERQRAELKLAIAERIRLEGGPKRFVWEVEFDVDPSWVADGFNMTRERAQTMIEGNLSFATPDEVSARITSFPPLNDILDAQGYEKDSAHCSACDKPATYGTRDAYFCSEECEQDAGRIEQATDREFNDSDNQ